MMISDDELTARLGRATTAPAALDVPAAVTTLLISDTRAQARTSRVRKIIASASVGIVVVFCGFATGPAVAEGLRRFLAQTDEPVVASSEVLAGSEWIDTSASDLGAYIESIYPDWLPLAPGQTKAKLIEETRASWAASPGRTQEVSLRRSLEYAVYVGWLDEWNAAYAAGDSDRMDAALAVLTDAPTWPALVATDGGGVTDLMAGFAAEIAAGNVEVAQAAAEFEGAASWDGVSREALIAELFAKYIPEAL